MRLRGRDCRRRRRVQGGVRMGGDGSGMRGRVGIMANYAIIPTLR